MNYEQTLNYLYNSLPMFSRMGSAAYKKDLHNIQLLCNFLGNPQTKFKAIHVGGTNGKGSVSHMLAATLQTTGYKTGLYTSPHLKDFRERIKVNGEVTTEDFVIAFTEKIKSFAEEIHPSFFEITVAMAFEYFAQQQVDVAIIEVGLGGRLDSTNIITPELSVITNISMDHMNMLGNTLIEIAGEKAGIIKQNIPVVIGEKHPETQIVFIEKAKQQNAPLYFAQDYFSLIDYQLHLDKIAINVADAKGFSKSYTLDLPGIYQTKNILTYLQAVEELRKRNFKILDEHVSFALANTKKITGLHGRWEVIHQQPTVVLEVAHNEDGMHQMLQHLSLLQYNQLHIVTGMVKDKDVDKVLELLPKQANYYFTNAHIPRALSKEELQQKGAAQKLFGKVYNDVNEAVKAAIKNAAQNDLIIVCGSIFLVAEVDKDGLQSNIA